MNRRQFLQSTSLLAAAAAASPTLALGAMQQKEPAPARLPRWRGFNLLEKYSLRRDGNPPFRETDFAWMAEWGFDFARLPMSYLCWTDPKDWLKLREAGLKDVDAAVELGRKHGIHVNLNLHRAPGFCTNPPKEPLNLWSDEKALAACAFHWEQLAARYKGISNRHLSFNLLNEPGKIPEETYVRVVKCLVEAIRGQDPQRLIIADGLHWGAVPVFGLAELGLAQSTHSYEPLRISHYRARWMEGEGSDQWEEPSWPLKVEEKRTINRETLQVQRIEPWKKLEEKGVGIHVGEWGAFNLTPHRVVLAWMRDCLDLWKEAGWGWALWNLRGPFGVLDSKRADVDYEDFRGSQLDRQMLEVLQKG